MATRRGPFTFFDFDGINSSVKLVDLDKWPSYGYTISMWISVDSFQDNQNSTSYQPRLFSCVNTAGEGLEIYFLHSILHVRTGGATSTPVAANFRSVYYFERNLEFTYSLIIFFFFFLIFFRQQI
jgi:hypothetical protein